RRAREVRVSRRAADRPQTQWWQRVAMNQGQRPDRLSGLRPTLAQPQYARAGGTAFAISRPGAAFGLHAIAGQPRSERRDQHRAHAVWTPRYRIGLGVDQKRLAHLIPGKRNLFVSGIYTLRPEITHVTRPAELRVGHGDGQVAKLDIDRPQHGGLQPARHRNV